MKCEFIINLVLFCHSYSHYMFYFFFLEFKLHYFLSFFVFNTAMSAIGFLPTIYRNLPVWLFRPLRGLFPLYFITFGVQIPRFFYAWPFKKLL